MTEDEILKRYADDMFAMFGSLWPSRQAFDEAMRCEPSAHSSVLTVYEVERLRELDAEYGRQRRRAMN